VHDAGLAPAVRDEHALTRMYGLVTYPAAQLGELRVALYKEHRASRKDIPVIFISCP